MSRFSRLSKKWAWTIGVFLVLGISTMVYAFVVKGPSGEPAVVDKEGRLHVKTTSQTFAAHVSEDEALLYSWTVVQPATAATTTTAYLAIINTDADKVLAIDAIIVGSDVVTGVTVAMMTATWTAAGGYAVSDVNLNSGDGNSAVASAYANATGLSALTVASLARIPANNSKNIVLEGHIILNHNDTIAIQLDTSGATQFVSVHAFYHQET